MNKEQNEGRLKRLETLIREDFRRLKFRLKMITYLDDDSINDAISHGLEKLLTRRRFLLDKENSTDSIRYVTVVAKNYLIDILRKYSRESRIDDVPPDEICIPPGQLVELEKAMMEEDKKEMKLKMIKEVMKQMAPQQREVLFCKAFEEMSYSEIALMLEISTGTVKATYHQAIKKLKKIIATIDEKD